MVRAAFASLSASEPLHPVDRELAASAGVHVYQHQDHRAVLEALVPFFGCGSIRSKGPRSNVLTYLVGRRVDLEERIIPFFERNPLVVKGNDFKPSQTTCDRSGRRST
jgi:hypothetical protein